MLADRWQRVEEIFTEASALPEIERVEFIDRACGADHGVRDEIRLLLTAADRSGDFLCAPALEVFARQVVREGWTVQPGERVASYTVKRRLGAGATGEVWRARDERLSRDVAIKFLLPHASNGDRVRAFEHESRAAGSLNHPNVLTVHDVGEYGGAPFLVTECLDGESLRARLSAGALPIDAALEIAVQVAHGLGAAHERSIVHRDLKPENIFLADDGRVKILDFGLATLLDAAAHAPVSVNTSEAAVRSLVAGTAGYMAPEQVRGGLVDQRADIFALGAVLYEMLAGRQPFRRNGALQTLDASLTLEPGDLAAQSPGISPALAGIVRRCLAKSADDRFTTSADLAAALESTILRRHARAALTLRAFFRQPAAIVMLLAIIAVVIVGAWQWRVASRARWARTVAAPEIQRLANRGDYAEAFLLARKALDVAPDDPHLRQLWLDVSSEASMSSEPEGAEVTFAAYHTPREWFVLGRTPLNRIRIPRTMIRLRLSKGGFEPIEGSGSLGRLNRYRLDPVDSVPAGMVRVVRGRDSVRFGAVGEIDDFWIDRFEVTNRQFQAFVDRGGYANRDYWREPFSERGRPVPWAQAIARFRDRTGRLGPATWISGTYPAGQADFPVGGVSWYEAAAFATFAGKSLPTMYHWFRAADLGRFADILTVSNFNGKGPIAVGSSNALGPFGTYDMAGNVKEWCWNETDDGRFLLGGAWNEPRYMFADDDAKEPFERAPAYGFRLAKYLGPLPATVSSAVRTDHGDGWKRKPVGDDIFAVLRRQYAYDRMPINAVLEAREETSLWIKETVAFDAAYRGERMHALLFLPKIGTPPYQAVLFFPAHDAFVLRSSRDVSLSAADFIVRSGRAFLYPIYKGTFERAVLNDSGPNEQRELRIAWSRDLGRAIDYLEMRSDIDHDRLAFYGISDGGDAGVILTALEPRLKTSILQGTAIGNDTIPELDLVNYAPRISVPTLMLNGRYDFGAPVDMQQRPLFALLGSRPEQKRHTVLETGHALSVGGVCREILPWLDRYLGPAGANQSLSCR